MSVIQDIKEDFQKIENYLNHILENLNKMIEN